MYRARIIELMIAVGWDTHAEPEMGDRPQVASKRDSYPWSAQNSTHGTTSRTI